MGKMKKTERHAIAFAKALHNAGSNGLTTAAATRATGGTRGRFKLAKDWAADKGFVYWQWDARAKRYFWAWADAQEGETQTWKGMRTRMRRQCMRHRSAIQAAAPVPSPAVPFKAAGPAISAIYDGLVAVGVLYWIAAMGSENAVPLGQIHAEATAILTAVVDPR